MVELFDDSRLDDESALESADPVLRSLAEAGARVRREAGAAAEAIAAAVAGALGESRPRAVVAAGPDSRLLRAVLEPWCPVPFVAWPAPSLPGWAGGLDLVVVLAPEGSDSGTASAVAEAVRRGCRVVVACPPRSLVADHAVGRDCTVLPCSSGDQLAAAVVMLEFLDQARPRPRLRSRGGRPGARRRRHRLLAAPRPGGQPGQDARHRAGRRDPAHLGRVRARCPGRPSHRRVHPAVQRAYGARRRRRAPASRDRRGTHGRPVRRPVRRRRGPLAAARRCWSSTTGPRERRCASSAAACSPRPRRGTSAWSGWPVTPATTSRGTPPCSAPARTPPPTSVWDCPGADRSPADWRDASTVRSSPMVRR